MTIKCAKPTCNTSTRKTCERYCNSGEAIGQYMEAYEKNVTRQNFYHMNGQSACPIVKYVNQCDYCKVDCLKSEFQFQCAIVEIPTKHQVIGRLKEVAPVYHRLVIMEALKQKSHLFGRK